MSLRQTVPPASEPVTLTELKTQLRIASTDEDAHLSTQIVIAREHVEALTRRQLLTATWELALDQFPIYVGSRSKEAEPRQQIRIPRPRLIAISSITYLDGNGATQTLAADRYRVDARSEPGRVEPAFGYTWPTARHVSNSVVITYTAGYGNAAAVPSSLKAAVLVTAAFLAENRGADVKDAPPAVAALVAPYVIDPTLFRDTV